MDAGLFSGPVGTTSPALKWRPKYFAPVLVNDEILNMGVVSFDR
jgi:hypothetical protein